MSVSMAIKARGSHDTHGGGRLDPLRIVRAIGLQYREYFGLKQHGEWGEEGILIGHKPR
jgi:hypothetical protein